ncbi:MAG TPA: response regulator [Nitrospiria bacterium]|jgi:CheY-like chemotaxis protein|nr:response regulator [Nitrospiria bacterium]
MAALCPKCHHSIQLEQIPLKKDIQMICDSCQAVLTVSLGVTLVSDSGRISDGPHSTPSTSIHKDKVLAIVEGEASNEMIGEVLTTAGFQLVIGHGGQDIMALLERERPAVVLVDVGLPNILGFEIATLIKKRNDLKDIRVILLAAIHDKTRYRREPESLYGADDYIERHHIQDELLPKIQRLLGVNDTTGRTGGPGPAAIESPVQSSPSASGRSAPGNPSPKIAAAQRPPSIEQVLDDMLEEGRKAVPGPSPAPDLNKTQAMPRTVGNQAAHDAAKRLARIIISDIALYNQRAIEDGIRNGTVYELLRDEIEEGKKLYESRVPAEISSSTDYYREAIDEFIRKRKIDLLKRT